MNACTMGRKAKKQMTPAAGRFETFRKKLKRDLFLSEMNARCRGRRCAPIEPLDPKASGLVRLLGLSLDG